MRKRLFEIIEIGSHVDIISRSYDIIMIVTIIISVFPLAFKQQTLFFHYIDKITCFLFIFDYATRIITADYKLKKKTASSFLLYPFTPMAIIDLLSILPSLTALNNSFKLFKILRLFQAFKFLKIFKAARYSKSISMIANIFKKQKQELLTVSGIAICYIFISALAIFNIEPDTFDNYFEAVYWAAISLTTVGYGDIYPVSAAGRAITMLSSIFGIAVVALPAGIITAGIMDEINQNNKTS